MKQIVAVDLETTGLDPVNDSVLEVAAYALDKHLMVIDQFHAILPGVRLRNYTPFILDMHTKNGLLNEQPTGYAVDIIDWFSKYAGCTLLGSSVSFDKRFLECQYGLSFDYHIIDVSSFKVLGEVPFKKSTVHRAKADIMYSIEVARYFRQLCNSKKIN